MPKYVAHHPKIPNKPGVNWVDKVGGLPKPIDAIMRALMAKGWGQQRAVATAVNSVKKTCATGRAFGGKTKVSGEARATACAAVASWEAKKAAAKSMANEDGRAIELAMKRVDGDALQLDMARSHEGLVQAKIQVRSRRGKTFVRTVWVRPKQAKALKRKGAKLSEQGAKVTGKGAQVLAQLAKIPKDKRPKGWQDAVRALADPKHGGRLGPAARKALHELGRNADKNSPLHKAVYGALGADAPGKKGQAKVPAKAKGKGKAKPKRGKDKTAGARRGVRKGLGLDDNELGRLPRESLNTLRKAGLLGGGKGDPAKRKRNLKRIRAALRKARKHGASKAARRKIIADAVGALEMAVSSDGVVLAREGNLVVVDFAEKKISAKEREKAPTAYGSSFPIRNRDELKRAVQSIGRAPAEKRAKVKAFCIRRAKALGAMDLIPDDWKKAAA